VIVVAMAADRIVTFRAVARYMLAEDDVFYLYLEDVDALPCTDEAVNARTSPSV